jgi:predicted  nucleic acid-binding Zn-ribbon protein
MSHRCVHCGAIYSAGSKEILTGCSKCGGHFFFYIKDEYLKNMKEIPEIPSQEKKQVEKQIREMAGITEEEVPIILDLESVRVVGSGKFEIDIVNLFNKKRPLIYKLEEGKYIIDLASTMGTGNLGKEDKRFIEISLDKEGKKKKKEEKEKKVEEEKEEEVEEKIRKEIKKTLEEKEEDDVIDLTGKV